MFFLRNIRSYRRVPSGLIVFFNDAAVPSGWTRFSGADDKLIIGAGSTYNPTDTGGDNNPYTYNESTSSAGNHDNPGGNFTTFQASSNSCNGADNPQVTAGAHTHTLGAVTYNPAKRTALLIKADSDYSTLPAKTMVLSPGDQTNRGLANVTDWSGKYIEGKDSIGNIAEVKTVALSSAGSHNHGVSNCFGPNEGQPNLASNAGAHTDDFALSSVTDNLKKVLLSLWQNASAAFRPYDRMIGMWESATPPGGWAVCDGTLGTPDLRDCFIQPVNSGSENTTASGDHTVDITVDSGDIIHTSSHTHASGTTAAASGATAWHVTDSWSHTHTHSMSNQSDVSWLPPYYALTFIMKR